MTQEWSEDVFELSHEGETDLFNIDNNFRCLKSLFSGGTYGLNTEAGTPWYNTNTPILGSGLLQIQKQGNDGWVGVLALSQESDNGLVWFHGDNMSNQEGWNIDTKITEDRVMALKNHGSGTYTTGRTGPSHTTGYAGQWNITGFPDHPQHNHMIYNARIGVEPHPEGDRVISTVEAFFGTAWSFNVSGTYTVSLAVPWYSDMEAVMTHIHPGAWRIRAQVGLVIYPDIGG